MMKSFGEFLARWLRTPLRHLRWHAAVALVVLSAGLAAGCSALDQKQREWIFQPTDRVWSGGLAAAQGMDEVWIPFTAAEDGAAVRLHGLWLPQADAHAPVLLYLHGARWDVRAGAPRMRRMHELGYAVLGIDYRGFGQSSPALPSETLAHEDALAAWHWLAAAHPGVSRYIYGHSLGSAIGVRLAAAVPDAAGLIIESGFRSLGDVVDRSSWGWLPISSLITQRFDSSSYIGRVRAPILVVHGSSDQLIPADLGRALYELAPEPKRWVLVDGGSHHNSNSLGQRQYQDAVAALFGVVRQDLAQAP